LAEKRIDKASDLKRDYRQPASPAWAPGLPSGRGSARDEAIRKQPTGAWGHELTEANKRAMEPDLAGCGWGRSDRRRTGTHGQTILHAKTSIYIKKYFPEVSEPPGRAEFFVLLRTAD
jgi:1,6-anhydro-N-acetylmuramate kinase